jgi:hypothetical protein
MIKTVFTTIKNRKNNHIKSGIADIKPKKGIAGAKLGAAKAKTFGR